jgi:hypothetical protein
MSLSVFNRVFPVIVLLCCLGGELRAQSTNGTNDDARFLTTDTISKGDVRDISVSGPQADSPFFIERQEAKAAMAQAGREGLGMYVPKPPRPPAREQIKKFFHSFFGSKKKKADGGIHPLNLTVSPSNFSLAQVSELEVTLKISNEDKKMIELLYPDNQRLEILTKDSSGNVVSRWSQDRVFDPVFGFVAIDPKEFIVYSERVSTSAMKPDQTYTIEVSVAGQEGYTTRATVKPTP